MILLIGLYLEADAARLRELMECLDRNVAKPCIEGVHIFMDTPTCHEQLSSSFPQLKSCKVRLIDFRRRVTYKDLLSYANLQLAGNIVVIANADIFFDHTLARLEPQDLTGKLLCLSRWDLEADGNARFFDHPSSQDAWIFHAPIRDFPCSFYFGVPGCDNRLAWEARNAGLVILNPSRSIRAYHLHLTRVRRYSESQRVFGPTSAVPARFLETRWLWFVVPCMGRLNDLQRTVPTIASQPRSTYVLVNYACPDEAGSWVSAHYPSARIVSCQARQSFKGAEARNRGAAAVDDDGIICFLDADVSVAADFSAHVLANFQPHTFLVPDQEGRGLSTTLICRKSDFDRAGGFDEAFMDWGAEVADLRDSLRRMGLAEHTFAASPLSHPHACHRTSFATGNNHREDILAIHDAYRDAKAAVLNDAPDAGATLRRLKSLVNVCQTRATTKTDTPLAAVAFRENMGYTIEQLHEGASSHNNDPRPFALIPETLAGRSYTQVVSCSVSPIE